MALRVTQQNLEVLSDGSGGKLRVTQQYVEVMGVSGSYQTVNDPISFSDSATDTDVPSGTTYNESVTDSMSVADSATEVVNRAGVASNSLALTDSAGQNDDHAVSGSNALGISDTATAVGDRPLSVSDTLALTDMAAEGDERIVSASDTLDLADIAGRHLDASASNDLTILADAGSAVADRPASGASTLALSHEADYEHDLPEIAANALGITDAAVASGDRRLSVIDAISFVDAASLPIKSAAAFSDLSILTDAAAQSGLTFASASDALALAQTVANGVIFVSVSDAMSLTHSPYAGQNITAAASNAIVLSQSDAPGIYFALGADSIVFVQLAEGDIAGTFIRAVADSLGFADAGVGAVHDFGRQLAHSMSLVQAVAVGQPKYVTAADILSLANIPDQHQGVANISIADPMDLKNVASRIQFGTASSTLTLTQAAFRRFFASTVLTLTSSAIGQIAKPMSDTLSLTDTAGRLLVFVRPMADSLGLVSSVTAFIDEKGALCQYAPYIGDGPGAGIPASMPTLGTAKLTLTYPFVAPTTTLVLRNPQFGNVDRLSFDRINRETRGGTLIMFADLAWPRQQTLNVTVTALTKQQKDNLLGFLALSVGVEIGLLDHESRQWKGIIMTPDATITNNDRGGYTVTFEFEGALL